LERLDLTHARARSGEAGLAPREVRVEHVLRVPRRAQPRADLVRGHARLLDLLPDEFRIAAERLDLGLRKAARQRLLRPRRTGKSDQ